MRVTRPSAPPAGYAKVHVHAGVSNGNRRGSDAAVARDQYDNYLGSSSLVIEGLHDSAALEAIACREGICLAEDLGLQRCIIACDAKQVIHDIINNSRGRYAQILTEIKERAGNFTCSFIFEGRAANTEAHSLAKFSFFVARGRHLWLTEPHDQTCIPLSVEFAE